MKKILHVKSSPRGENSQSIRLANRIIEKLQEQYPGSTVTVNDTVEKNYRHLSAIHPVAYKTPVEEHTAEQKEALRDSDDAIRQLVDADIIIISAPSYNFHIPSALKAWLDHIVRPGKTLSYKSGKPEGLLVNKKVYLALASNGVYSDGPMKPWDFAEPYLRFILGFIGLTDITTYRIEGLAITGVMETAVERGLASVAV